MKKIKIIFITLTFFLSSLYAETELELLWDKARNNSNDFHSAEFSLKNANELLRKKSYLYPFNLKTVVNSSFCDIYPEVTWCTTDSNASIVVSKVNPYGNSISGSFEYGIDRSLINYFVETVDTDDIGYSHNPEFSLNVNQSLLPAFFQGYKKNPEVEILRSNVKTAEFDKSSVELSLLQNVCNYYIQYRCTKRQIDKYLKYLSFYDAKILAANDLYKNSKISISEVWNFENKKWEYYEYYIQALQSKENIEISLKKLCGELPDELSTENIFPDQHKRVVEYNPSKERIIKEIEKLKLQNIVRKQSNAPELSIGGSFSETTKTNNSLEVNYIENKSSLSWNFSLGVSFSDFFSPSRIIQQHQFENNLILFQEQLQLIEEQTENQILNYTQFIKTYQNQIDQFKEIRANREKFYKDYQQLFKDGKCSRLELEEVNLNLEEAECIYNNLKDYLWMYEWLRTQCQ